MQRAKTSNHAINDREAATNMSTTIRAGVSPVQKLEVVLSKGSTKECQVGTGLTYKDYKGGGTVLPLRTVKVTTNKAFGTIDAEETSIKTLVQLQQVPDVKALSPKGNVYVNLEDDQGGGSLFTTEALEKSVHKKPPKENRGEYRKHVLDRDT